jgi:hypothetical protein
MLFRSDSSDEDRGQPSEHRSERQRAIKHSAMLSCEQPTIASCERRESRAAARSQAGAPLFWTNERADTFFVCERARKAAADKRQPQRAERAICKDRAEAFFTLRATTTAADPRCSRRRSAGGDGGTMLFPFRQLRRRRRQPSEHRSERQRAIKHSAMCEQLTKRGCRYG